MKKRIAATLILTLCVMLSGCKGSDYKEALAYQESGDYASAIAIFEQLGEYKDASSKLEECRKIVSYNEALELMEEKDFSGALVKFTDLGSFRDSSEKKAFCEEMLSAVNAFEAAAGELSSKNDALDFAISTANEIVSEKALDKSIQSTLKTAISEAKAAKVDIPEMPDTAVEIAAKAKEMTDTDYTDCIENLNCCRESFKKSIKQYSLVNNPTEEYVINCLKTVPGVLEISAATEENDPNGKLGKARGYTAAVYFSHENVNQSAIYGNSILEKGTDCGGQIEVYANEADANMRNQYLATYDGTIFASGSHTVLGTCVIRTSNELTASKQRELEANIIDALTKID